jgi:hypothetical protein
MLLGTASATLVGLLFVVASLNLKHLQDVGSWRGTRCSTSSSR